MNNLDADEPSNGTNTNNGSMSFFRSFQSQQALEQSLYPANGLNEAACSKAAKRRSIFTVSSVLPTTVSESSSQNLMNLASEMNSLTNSERKASTGTEGKITPNKGVDHSDEDGGHDGGGSPKKPSTLLTPPTTPMKLNLSAESGLNSLNNKKYRHNSLENLHRPKNHRSRAKKSKTRQKRSRATAVDENLLECPEMQYHYYLDSDKWVLPADRKTSLACRAAAAFAMSVIRKLKIDISNLELDNGKKTRESAARLILHSLLLNSWRQCRRQNEKLQKENCLHLRSLENMCLQLRVLRQMHREEKEKSQSRSLEVSAMSIQIADLKQERNKIQSELEKVENELNNFQVYVETLTNKNTELLQSTTELKKAVARVELERQDEVKNRARLEMEHIRNEEKLNEVQHQLQQESKLRLKWQEESRGKESEILGLQSDLDQREKHLQQVKSSYEELKKELHQHKQATQRLYRDELQLKSQLEAATAEIVKLTSLLEDSEKEIRRRDELLQEMKDASNEKQTAMIEVKENLSLFLGDGVVRRRRLANAFHYLVFPLDIIRSVFDMPRDHASYYMVDLKAVNDQ